jgi:hypothetical protein
MPVIQQTSKQVSDEQGLQMYDERGPSLWDAKSSTESPYNP